MLELLPFVKACRVVCAHEDSLSSHRLLDMGEFVPHDQRSSDNVCGNCLSMCGFAQSCTKLVLVEAGMHGIEQ